MVVRTFSRIKATLATLLYSRNPSRSTTSTMPSPKSKNGGHLLPPALLPDKCAGTSRLMVRQACPEPHSIATWMTSTPASRKARVTTLAPRSCPSRPGLAMSTRIFFISYPPMLRLLVHYTPQRGDWEVPGNKKPLPCEEGA